MEMRHRLAAIPAIVDNQSKSRVGYPLAPRHVLRDKKEMPHQRLIGPGRGGHPWNFLLWNDEDMHRRLGVDVMKSEAELILINNPGRDFTGNDFREDGAHDFHDSGGLAPSHF